MKRKRKRTVEIYYAIQIGRPGRHQPYFMVHDGTDMPMLYVTRDRAQRNCPNQPDTKVVKVRLTT